MQSFSKINLNGHTLSAENGTLLINGSPINVKLVEYKEFDENLYLKKEDAKKLYSFDPKSLSNLYYPANNPDGFLSKADFSDFPTKQDFENFKKEALCDFKKLNAEQIQKYVDLTKRELRKSKAQEKLSEQFSLYDQVESLIEAFNGKPQKLEKIKEVLLKIKTNVSA